ncbi:MAG: 1-aminocyclopropane-1-carboxylate deaminase/D-cysteine desulfhydrase [Acidimicrobiia bacterium]
MSSPRAELATLPTRLDPMDRLAAAVASPARLLVKRDDLTGLALGGNKARKLEYLCGEAVDRGRDTLVTGGGPQSNHARMTAAAANRLGLECHLALAGTKPKHHDGNLLLDDLLGATLHFSGARDYYEIETSIEKLAAELLADGHRPFTIPVGGASVTGVVAYARAIDELRAQIERDPDWIFVADGSGGTHAGLLAGLGANSKTRVVGVDVGTRPDLDEIVPKLAAQAARAAGRGAPSADVIVDHDHFGAGYGVLTDECTAAIRSVARSEGIFLDPVYSGKAMVAMLAWLRDGRISAGQTVVFWHTGGSPALFVDRYEDAFTHEP